MTNYKFTYFNVTALGEHIIYLFAYGGIEYEDNRVQGEKFQALKPSLPFGQLPLIEFDGGKRATQSIAIGRYLARKVGLYGQDDYESLKIDEAVDQVNDFRAKIVAATSDDDGKVRAQKILAASKNEIPFFLERFNKFAANSGYLVNGRLSLADVYFAGIFNYLNHRIGYNLFDNYPNLQQLIHNVENEPNIKKYIDKRPVACLTCS